VCVVLHTAAPAAWWTLRHAAIDARQKQPMSQRILLIQDDAAAAKAILNALSNSRDELFQVEWVRCCSDGLERLTGSSAILVDLSLPDSRGIETFDRLFNVARQIPILILCTPPR